jgi:hypothetical protein
MSSTRKTFVISVESPEDVEVFLTSIQETKVVAIKNPGTNTFRRVKISFIYPVDPTETYLPIPKGAEHD